METVRQFLARRALWPLWAGLAAVVILLPGLGRYGFWEPQEISVADSAKKRLERYSLTEITAAVANQYKVRPTDLSTTAPSATDLTRARQITAYLASTYTREPDFEIIQAAGLA
ncbi:MAG TPA: hypothetical protein VL172_01970, partial [Kofleriaceae bacterium]|nr:hypothetical protein [Kofleriaceae bacterium]